MALRPIVIPLDGGHDTTVDKRLAGLARFRSVVNGRLDADGRVISRPRYQQLATTTYGTGTFAAYDLFELDGRLCALGDRLSRGFPTDVFEYVAAGAAWRPTDTVGSTIPRLPRATGIRELPRPPDQEGGISGFDVAAAAGYVVLAYMQSSAGLFAFTQLISVADGQTVLVRKLGGAGGGAANDPSRHMRAVGLTSRLFVIGARPDLDEIRAERIDPATDTSWTAVGAALITTSNDFQRVDACKVGGVDQFVVAAYDDGGRLRIRRFDSSGTVVVPSGGQYADVTSLTVTALAVEADSTGNTVNVAVVHSGTLRVYSYNLATGATLGSPPVVPTEASGETATACSIARSTSGTVHVLATITTIGTPDVPRVYRWIYTTATQAFGAGVYVVDSLLASHAVQPDTGVATAVFGIVRAGADTTPNMLVEHAAGNDQVAPLATKDLGIAAQPVAQLPHIAVDTSLTPTRYYWAHALEATDGSTGVVVCEVRLTDSGRRQVARVGRGAIIAGGCPVWYDGVELVEMGFTQRPRVATLTASNSTGTLFGGATYSYVALQTWFDALGRIHRGPVSLPEDVTLGASDDTVAVRVGTAITLRHNAQSAAYGSVARDEIYRTRVTQTKTAAEIVGTGSLEPPSSSLNGLTLRLLQAVTGVGFNVYTVTFAATDDTVTEILTAVNAVIGTTLTATAPDGVLVITHDTLGEGTSIIMGNGTANSILGFTTGDRSVGTTDNERGEVFHLTDSDFLAIGGDAGAIDGITDTRDDDDADTGLGSQAVLYTLLEGPVDDHAPGPADYVWSGNERVFAAGLPNRAAWKATKRFDTIRAPAFASEGRSGFGNEVTESVEAIVTHDVSSLLFTRRGIWQVDGEGPDDNGQGRFNAARRVFSDGGIVANGWRSILQTAIGDWFQLDDDKLYLLAPGGAPEWKGFPIRELMRSFPVIAAACLTHNDQMAAFALQNTGGTAGRIALYDLRRDVWYVDDVSACPQALADYQGRLCYVDESHRVWMADATAGSGTFIPLTVTTGHATEFDVAGQGAPCSVMLVGELIGECTVALTVDYDDGAGFISAGDFALTTANGYTVGQTVRLEFMLAQQDAASFALGVATSGSSGSAGLALVAVVVYAEKDSGPALLGSRFRR